VPAGSCRLAGGSKHAVRVAEQGRRQPATIIDRGRPITFALVRKLLKLLRQGSRPRRFQWRH
jgi:hypothetical protein